MTTELREYGDGKTLVVFSSDAWAVDQLRKQRSCFKIVPYEQEQYRKKKFRLIGFDFYFPLKLKRRLGRIIAVSNRVDIYAGNKSTIKHRRKCRFSLDDKQYILDRDKGLCVYCGMLGDVVDHVIPVYEGGPSDRSNGVCSCKHCNSKKHKRMDEDMLSKALNWLKKKGEDISWVESHLALSV